MTEDQARALAVVIFAAFPAVYVTDANVSMYSRFLAELDNPKRAAEAVDVAIRECTRLPTIKDVRIAYAGLRAKYMPRAIEETTGDSGPLSEEERAENLRRLREMITRLQPASGRTPPPEPTTEGASE